MDIRTFVSLILYMALGVVLAANGLTVGTWGFWAVLFIVAAVDIVSVLKEY